MSTKLSFATAIFALFISSCHSQEPESHPVEAFEVKVQESGIDFKIPAKIWDLLLDSHEGAEAPKSEAGGEKEGGEGGEGKKGEAAPELTTASFLYAPMEVVLKEKNAGVLKEPLIKILLPDGGGEIDLAKWTTGKPGTFFVNFEFDGRENPENEAKAFFYSRARKRRVGDQTIGSGCKAFMDLTALLVDPKKPDQLIVNTTRNFHTSVLGGHFLFSWKTEGNRKVTQVSFNDTAHPQYFCESEKSEATK